MIRPSATGTAATAAPATAAGGGRRPDAGFSGRDRGACSREGRGVRGEELSPEVMWHCDAPTHKAYLTSALLWRSLCRISNLSSNKDDATSRMHHAKVRNALLDSAVATGDILSEREGLDRVDTTLPGQQVELVKQVLAAGRLLAAGRWPLVRGRLLPPRRQVRGSRGIHRATQVKVIPGPELHLRFSNNSDRGRRGCGPLPLPRFRVPQGCRQSQLLPSGAPMKFPRR